MCRAIYFFLIGLLSIYNDWVLEQHSLAVTSGPGDWMPIAVGWEIAFPLWPLLALSAVVASTITFFAMGGSKRNCCSGDSR